jgi:RHS repeat-associated protein
VDRSRAAVRALLGVLWISIAVSFSLPEVAFAMPAPGEPTLAEQYVSEATGAATLRIPIAVPPGPGGTAPKLALVYSSSAGDGPFGVGWMLPLGEIACSVRYGVPDYINPGTQNDCPWFELDGELLVYDWGQNRYHTFVESFQRILRMRSTTGEWVITSPDGTIRRYGQTANSRILAPSGKVARWLLSAIEDPYGNQITFEYDDDPGTIDAPGLGHTYIKRISWAGGNRIVEFEYEVRPDPIHDYAEGIQRNIAYRATEIRVTSLGGVHSRYLLGYDLDTIGATPKAADYTTARSRLSWAKRFGAGCTSSTPLTQCTEENGLALPAQEFRYTDPKDGGAARWVDALAGTNPDSNPWKGEQLEMAPPRYNLGPIPTAVRMADVNGDGLVDYVTADHNHAQSSTVALNTGSGWGAQEMQPGSALAAQEAAYTNSLRSLRFQAPNVKVWFENDTNGLAYDICAATRGEAEIPVSFNIDGGVGSTNLTYNEINSWAVQFTPTFGSSPWGAPVNPSTIQLLGNFQLVDLDGDHRADLVMSVRLSGVHRTLRNCNGGPRLNPPEEIFPQTTFQIAFRNTSGNGGGWVLDPSLIQGLPPFQMLITEGLRYVWSVFPSGIDNEQCFGMLGNYFGAAGESEYGVAPCTNYISLEPVFTDLDGDGRLDLIVAVPDNPDVLFVHNRWVNFHPSFPGDGSRYGWQSNTRSLAFLSRADGSWQRSPSFDLPFHHVHLQALEDRPYPWDPRGTNSHDLGVRFVDLNRDGYLDVIWKDPFQDSYCPHSTPGCPLSPGSDYYFDPGVGYASKPQGVLLNRGKGSSSAYSAWCSSRALGSVDPCPPESEAQRFELPDGARFAELQGLGGLSGPSYTVLADLNGDGWLDLARGRDPRWDDVGGGGTPAAAWLFSPGSTGASFWVPNDSYAPPILVGPLPPYNGYLCDPSQGYPADVNGDGVIDWIRAHYSAHQTFLSQKRLPDLLREARTGRGGTIQIAYETGPRQRDFGLEADAADHANDAEIGEPLGQVGDALGTLAPVVASVTVTGPNRTPAQIRYRYADSRWDRALRIGLGWRAVEVTRADGSVVSSFHYQQHGRVGRLSERTTYDRSGHPLQHHAEEWELPDPGDVEGGWVDPALPERRSHIGRLARRSTRNEYGDTVGASIGAVQEETFEYDDAYGYNFLTHISTTRPSGGSERYLSPFGNPDLPRWILHLVREDLVMPEAMGYAQSGYAHKVDYTYTSQGRVAMATRTRERNDDGERMVETDFTQFGYDGYGNLIWRFEENDAHDRTTEFGYDPDTRSVVVRRTDPAVGLHPAVTSYFTPHPIFGVPIETRPGSTDVPGERIELDAFGRVAKRWTLPRSNGSFGAPVLVAAAFFDDRALPPTEAHYAYTSTAGAQGDAIRTATVDDGFGGVWKTIRANDAGAGGAERFIGTATWLDPANRISRTTYDLPCNADDWCSSLVGTETPAVVTLSDGLGRPVQVSTPDGTSLSHYRGETQPIVGAGASIAPARVDVVLSQNANGHLELRSTDGDRVVAVDECANSDDAQEPIENEGCSAAEGVPNRTLYGYHPNGQLEVIYDVIAVSTQAWSDAMHQLRYHFDSAGQVTRIDDPDAGVSRTRYDHVGNVIWTANARNQVRALAHDELDRVINVGTPEGSYIVTYEAGKQLPKKEVGPSYSIEFAYDIWGRLSREAITTGGRTLGAYSFRDMTGRRTYSLPYGVNLPTLTGIRTDYAGAFLKAVCQGNAAAGGSCSTPIVNDVTYDEVGLRDQVTLPQGIRDLDFSPTRRHLAADRFAGATVMEYTQHDGLGNVVSWKSPLTGVTSGSYSYDARNRLSSWTRNGETETFGYDALGNLTRHGTATQTFADSTRPHAISQRSDPRTGEAPELRNYGYDLSGNLTSVTAPGTPARYYRFDSANRMVCARTTQTGSCDVLSLIYDLSGRRIYERAGGASGITRRFVGDDFVHTVDGASGEEIARSEAYAFGERVGYVESITKAAHAASTVAAWPEYELDLPPWALALPPALLLAWSLGLALRGGLLLGIARRPGSAAVCGVLIVSIAVPYPAAAGLGGSARTTTKRWVLSDRIGSGIVELDELGNVAHQIRFKPFGGIDQESAAPLSSKQRMFAGHRQQPETGLVYMNARWQEPSTGTFLSVDPLIVPTDPQSHTGYSYARNNPVSNTDPTGMCTPSGEGCGGSAAATSMLMGHSLPTALASMGVVVPGLTYSVFDTFVTAPGAEPHESEGESSGGSSVAAAAGPAPSAGGRGGFFGAMGDAARAVGGAIERMAGVLIWDLALALVGNVGNLYGIGLGLVTTFAGIATLNPSLVGSGLSQILWALVPRYGFWSGPGWGQPNFEANHGSWFGPYSSQNVIEGATYQHDQDHRNPGADQKLIHDVWSRHDLGPYGQIYRVGLTAMFGTGIALGMDD